MTFVGDGPTGIACLTDATFLYSLLHWASLLLVKKTTIKLNSNQILISQSPKPSDFKTCLVQLIIF